jgi:sugar lactone lactonase YvrE
MHSLLEKASVFAEGLDHPECVIIHPDGSLWAGGEAGQIYRISQDGKEVEEVANTGGFILGIAFSPGAKWMAICDLGKKCLWRLDMDSLKLEHYADRAGDHRFNIPNYAVFDSHENLYVTESGDFRQVTGKILKYDKNGNGEVWHPGPFNFTNGLAMGPEEKFLCTVVSFTPGIERVFINNDGSAGEREVYCTLPESVPDGCAFDHEGNLYVSCYAPNKIFKIAVDRTATVLVEDWEAHTLSNPTNIAFGGAKLDQLYTANLGRWHITRIDAGIKGLPLVSHSA